jgi:hypothetical protein
VHAWTLAFAEVGHPVDAWRIHRRIGMGSGRLLDELLGDDADRLADDVDDLVHVTGADDVEATPLGALLR